MTNTEPGDASPRTEAERAAYYDAHRAEVQAWPEVPPPDARKPKQRGVIMSARFTLDDAEAIERAAKDRGLSVSAFIRAAAQDAAGAASAPVNTSRIADRLVALAEELRPGSMRRAGVTNAVKKATQPTAGKIARGGQTSRVAKTAAAASLGQRSKKKTG